MVTNAVLSPGLKMIIIGGFLLFPREQMENGVLSIFEHLLWVFKLFEDYSVNDKVCSLMSLHCPKNNLNFCIKTKFVMAGADARVYAQLLFTYCTVYSVQCTYIWPRVQKF